MKIYGFGVTKNAVTMNVKKTKYMSFGTWQRLDQYKENNVILSNQSLEKTVTYKYLGTYLDSNLNFVRRANETKKLVNLKLNVYLK